ncbi:MAG TPA: glycosyltransferase family 39 protein [Thermoanaerobaculia bacterium]
MRYAWVAFAVSVVVRIGFVFSHGLNSDEPQHLHVAWAWSRGLVQYRDVFDNHLPLLHVLFAPLFRVMDEESSVFVIARLVMLPVALASAWLVYLITRRLTGPYIGLMAATVFNVIPPWLPKSVEFRNDTLWVFLWLASIACVAAPKRPRWGAAGLLSGLCILASIKAVPLLLAHAIALVVARRLPARAEVLRFAAGLAVPLLVCAVAFASVGALGELVYATLLYNAAVPVAAARRIGGAIAFAVIAAVALRYRPPGGPVTLFAGGYVLVILCFWPIVTPRDFLPLAAVGAFALAWRARTWRAAPVTLLVLTIAGSIWYARLWRPPDLSRHQYVDAVLAITTSRDFVYDLKGDSVFRRRAVYPIYDVVGRALTAKGDLKDRGPEAMVARGCCVAMRDTSFLPPRSRAFLARHFLDTGHLRVCGTTARDGTFEIAVPQVYAISSARPSMLLLDGRPYDGPRFLRRGRHTLAGPGAAGAMIVWSPAVEAVRDHRAVARVAALRDRGGR